MPDIYLIFVIVLILLAISDLVVGVSNDAANFLNSAVGSKVAPLKVILAIAGLGVVIGATFSSGMMEIARSGVFHPGQFVFAEIMIIFLAVMITDVMLLDTFNTFGLPTSTTVSIIFELLGAAVAISLVKIFNSTETLSDLGTYINSAKALAIISGILLSVVIAFGCGTIVMFITRLIFSFNYERFLKYFGSIWGGIAITAIIYFILVKGAEGASFMTPEKLEWLHYNTSKLLLFSFLGLTVLFQLLVSLFKINILKIIVLVGTFSLAMAFAGNDLVNFIGVPLAGLDSYNNLISDPSFNPNTFTMESLTLPVKTPTIFLLTAGLIMVLTLFFSKKARTVTATEVNLSRQGSGIERFSSTLASRSIVRVIMVAMKTSERFIPQSVTKFLDSRFDSKSVKKKLKQRIDPSSFDLLRASVNMFVASILIASATSLKLPLSTTYVTFMVAMGTSLADRSWGRESAVYRVTGVITVISGWFFTAFIAFTASFIIAIFLNWGGIIATIIALAFTVFFVIRTHFIHKKIVAKTEWKDEFDEKETISGENILKKCDSSIISIIGSVSKLYFSTVLNLIKEDRRKMRKVTRNVDELNQRSKELKYNIYPTLRKLEEESIETGPFYVQILDYIREIAHCLKYLADPAFEHLDNNHPPLLREQVKDLHELNESISEFYDEVLRVTTKHDFKNIDKLIGQQHAILDLIFSIKKRQIKFIKSESTGTRNILMYLNLLSETKNIVHFSINMVKSHRDFIISDVNKLKN